MVHVETACAGRCDTRAGRTVVQKSGLAPTYIGLYRGYIGIMEKKMETTIL